MNIYVETNFVLELVFEQEQHESCEKILALCSSGKSRIVIPAYCLAEPQEKLTRQALVRNDLQLKLQKELPQVARTASYSAETPTTESIASLFVRINEEQNRRFMDYRARLFEIAEIIPLTLEVLKAAAECETRFELTPQDALVYASVIDHLQQNQPQVSCFLNRNWKDFGIPDIIDDLVKMSCRMIPRFDHGFEFVNARTS